MKKQRKDKSKKRPNQRLGKTKKGNKPGRNLWLQIIIALVLISGIVLLSVKPSLKKNPNNSSARNSEIAFKKEGELTFLKNGSNKEIKTIDIEIAETSRERIRGLMYRYSMAENEGMLFIMDKEEPQAFWMRNTYISLDIMYVDKDFRIVKIWKYTEPLSDKSLPSGKAAKYVVEVIAGFSDKYKVTEGDFIRVKRQPPGS